MILNPHYTGVADAAYNVREISKFFLDKISRRDSHNVSVWFDTSRLGYKFLNFCGKIDDRFDVFCPDVFGYKTAQYFHLSLELEGSELYFWRISFNTDR